MYCGREPNPSRKRSGRSSASIHRHAGRSTARGGVGDIRADKSQVCQSDISARSGTWLPRPGEPDYQYSVPLGDSTKAHFVLCNAGFESTLKKAGFWAYVRTRPPDGWIKGWGVPSIEQVENAFATFRSMGYLARKSGDQVIELVDSMHDGYPYRVPPKPENPRHFIADHVGGLIRKIAGRLSAKN